MERWQMKTLSIFIAWVVIIFFVLLPIKVASYFERKGKKGVDILNTLSCFSGGVFLGTYLLHMAPEVRVLLEESLLQPNEIDFPIPELIIGGGFFFVLFMEKTISYLHDRSVYPSNPQVTPLETVNKHYQNCDGGVMVAHGNDSSKPEEDKAIEIKVLDINQNVETPASNPHSADSHESAAAKSLLLLVGLGLHCIFEGMSIGLKHTIGGVRNMLIAILCHEFIIAFSMGLQLVSCNPTRKVVLGGFLYSVMTPSGIAIGTALMETVGASNTLTLVNGILQGIAAGTFIYATFFEILKDHVSHDTKLLNLLAILIGFGVMAGLSAIPEEDDEPLDSGHGNTTIIPFFA